MAASKLHPYRRTEGLLTFAQIDSAHDATTSAVEAAQFFFQNPGRQHLAVGSNVLIPELRGQIGFRTGNRYGGSHRGVSVAVDQIIGQHLRSPQKNLADPVTGALHCPQRCAFKNGEMRQFFSALPLKIANRLVECGQKRRFDAVDRACEIVMPILSCHDHFLFG